jgi:hypothetical protein
MLFRESPPEAFGSGKFGTPCERMHVASRSSCERDIVLVCPDPPARPGSSDWQAFCAISKAGVFLSSGGIVSCPLLDGSGKSETPCERMHRANFTASASTLGEFGGAPAETPSPPPADELEPPPVGVVVGEEPPQPASASAALAAMAAGIVLARSRVYGDGA